MIKKILYMALASMAVCYVGNVDAMRQAPAAQRGYRGPDEYHARGNRVRLVVNGRQEGDVSISDISSPYLEKLRKNVMKQPIKQSGISRTASDLIARFCVEQDRSQANMRYNGRVVTCQVSEPLPCQPNGYPLHAFLLDVPGCYEVAGGWMEIDGGRIAPAQTDKPYLHAQHRCVIVRTDKYRVSSYELRHNQILEEINLKEIKYIDARVVTLRIAHDGQIKMKRVDRYQHPRIFIGSPEDRRTIDDVNVTALIPSLDKLNRARLSDLSDIRMEHLRAKYG
ncbi:MAG: hypothetical protein LBJ42_01110 [Holosporales bacterium]|jgi:hypothetical protein|nr:hypothetical protein [Holosporales bacterium]